MPFLALVVILMLSCTSNEKSDAGVMHVVRCKYWMQKCYFQAREKCFRSYEVVNSSEVEKVGGPWGVYKEFILQIKCRDHQ